MIKLDITQKPAEGQMVKIEQEKNKILLANIEGKLHAVTDKCPHLGCSLAKGQLDGAVVTCPCHGSTFDVTNGELLSWVESWGAVGKLTEKIGMAKGLQSFPVVENNDGIVIEL